MIMDDRNDKIVNEQEQNRPVNPEGKDYEKKAEPASDNKAGEAGGAKEESRSGADKENPGGSEVERPHKIEGDDAGDIERKIPNL